MRRVTTDSHASAHASSLLTARLPVALLARQLNRQLMMGREHSLDRRRHIPTDDEPIVDIGRLRHAVLRDVLTDSTVVTESVMY